MTAAQLEPSAHAPCTSTTLRASVGAAVCARASNPLSVAANAATVSAITNRAIFIIPAPWPRLPCAALRVISVFGRWGRNVTGVHSSVNFRGRRVQEETRRLDSNTGRRLEKLHRHSGPAPSGASTMCACTSGNDDGKNAPVSRGVFLFKVGAKPTRVYAAAFSAELSTTCAATALVVVIGMLRGFLASGISRTRST